MSMFCFQCQETFKNSGCIKRGVCGKTSDVANLQDFLIWISKGLSEIAVKSEREKKEVVDRVILNLFTTITNANFDFSQIKNRIFETIDMMNSLREDKNYSEAANWSSKDFSEIEEKISSGEVSILAEENEDVRSLKELITYGLKGMAAYARHAKVLGYESEKVNNFILTTIGTRNKPGILVSGHDLKDFEMLLEQAKDSGVDIYTHSEMLPANYYPSFKKYENFVGNYGNAWWKQRDEFETFNGPILMTTNCIVPPKDSYKDKLFTTGAAGYPGCKYIEADEKGHKDFSEIIELAKTCKAPEEIEKGSIVGGFAHSQVMELADKVIEAVKNGDITKFIVMAGCDGRMADREYYTEFAEKLPKSTVILTAGCAKYRYNKLNLGDINGIPRVLDAGQCNDSYSLIQIALALVDAFGVESVNDLPLVYNIAWYEQKAVIVLLALLSLGVKNIHLGPSLPAFLSPNVTDVLVEKFNIAGISNVEDDIKNLII